MSNESAQVEGVQKNVQESVQNVTVSRVIRRYRAWLFQGYITSFLVGFIVLATFAHFTPYFPIDLTITKGIQSYHTVWFDILMRFISFFGTPPQGFITVLVIGLFLYYIGLRWESVTSVLTASVTTVVGILIKTIVHRQRPSITLVTVLQHLKDSSFPSGHVMLYTAFFGFLFFLAYTLIAKSTKRKVILVILASFILLVGPSRVYLGEHWASDVFGAYLIGSILLTGTIYFYNWGKNRYFIRQPTAPSKSS